MCSATADALLITCEHGGNTVPQRYAPLFRDAACLLESHRGYDPGALAVARVLARRWKAPLHASRTTRLLVDLNRSPGHPRLFSEITRALDTATRARILEHHYFPYRTAVEEDLRTLLARHGRVVHLSIHSFTPVWHGAPRTADIGLLYDPRRGGERRLAEAWQQALRDAAPHLRIRRNYPYLGRSDGLTRHLRTVHPARAYLGLEVELSQGLFTSTGAPRVLATLLTETFDAARP